MRSEELWQLSAHLGGEADRLGAILAESGKRLAGRQNNPAYVARLAESAEFLADVMDGRRSMHWLQEALSTSDFPLLMGDILDRQMLGRYRETPPVWQNFAKRGTVRDF